MADVGLAGGALLALVLLDAEGPGGADEVEVVAGAVGAHGIQQAFEARIQRGCGEDYFSRPGWGRRPLCVQRWSSSKAEPICSIGDVAVAVAVDVLLDEILRRAGGLHDVVVERQDVAGTMGS
jgi:predicted RecB family endonuclease